MDISAMDPKDIPGLFDAEVGRDTVTSLPQQEGMFDCLSSSTMTDVVE